MNAFLWLCLTAYLLIEMIRLKNGLSALLVGFFMFLNVLGLFLSGKYIVNDEKWAYFLGLAVLVLNSLVSLTGLFGWMNWLVIIFNIFIFIFLLSFRQAYLTRS